MNHLEDIPACAREIALHRVCHGAVVALAAAQVQSGHELRTVELGFPMADDLDDHDALIEDFADAAAAVVDITSADSIVNVFLGP